jgi:mRNA interferase MazF
MIRRNGGVDFGYGPDQLTTVSKQRMGKKAGEITPEEMIAVELAIRVQLRLS